MIRAGRKSWLPVLAAVLAAAAGLVPARPASAVGEVGEGPLGRRGGRLVAALASEPRTLNPLTATDISSLTVIGALTADLIHIDRVSQQPESALARAWKVSEDGRRYTLELRRGLRFSDGRSCDADDVVFSFGLYLDQEVASPQRDLLMVGGRPISVEKVDSHTVDFVLAEPYAAAERLFDGFAILPRHLLQEVAAGDLSRTWGPGTAPDRIAGLGPFRLKEHRPGERLVLERNPYYWKRDPAGESLPYLDELVFVFVASQDAQVLRFQAGALDVVDRLSAESFALLEREAEGRGYQVFDLGPGLDYNFLFFNLNPVSAADLPQVARSQTWFRRQCFRHAVSQAVDRPGMVRLVYRSRATALATHVTPGNKRWVHGGLRPPTPSPDAAGRRLAECGFSRRPDGALVDGEGREVGFTLLTVAGSSERQRMATIVQQDLAALGMAVEIAALELPAVLERLFASHDYQAALLGLGGGDADPNPMMSLLLSSGSHHLWHPGQSEPATPWEAEIDRLMRRQLITLDREERKRLYDRVQEIVAEELPIISLVTPNVLVGARQGLGSFRPAVLDPSTLWNVEELFWQPGPGRP